METVASRLQDTGHRIAKQGDAFVARTRHAGVAFFGETHEASLQLFGAVRTEAKRWRRFATQRATHLQSGLRTSLALPVVERVVLTRVDGTLKALDAVVRARLAELERRPAKPSKKTNGAKSSRARARKTKAALPPIAA